MPGPAPATKIVLDDAEAERIRQLARSQTAPFAQVLRARIIQLAAQQPNLTNVGIAKTLGCGDRTVRKWRSRYVQTQSLTDAPRPGAPRRFSPSSSRSGDGPRL